MKILLTVHQFLPDHAAGTELVTWKVASELRRRGHDVRIFTGHPGEGTLADAERLDEYTYDGIPVWRFLHARVPIGGQTNLAQAEYNSAFIRRRMAALLAAFQPDIVHFFHLMRLTASMVDVCRAARIPTLYTLTDFWPVCPQYRLRLENGAICPGPSRNSANCLRHILELTRRPEAHSPLLHLPDSLLDLGIDVLNHTPLLRRWGRPAMVAALSRRPHFLRDRLAKIDRLLVLTQTMRAVLLANAFDPRNITVLPHGIDATGIHRTAGRGGNHTLRLGFLGTIAEHKGCHILIQAVRALPPEVPIQLSLHGNLEEFPDYTRRLRALAADDPRITFAGGYPHAQVGGLLDSFDALVVPSLWYENTPLVIYEAQAAGCPVVASRLGGMAELVTHERDGLLFEPGSIPALATALQRLADDRPLLQRLAADTQAPKSILDYVTELEAMYNQLAQARPNPR